MRTTSYFVARLFVLLFLFVGFFSVVTWSDEEADASLLLEQSTEEELFLPDQENLDFMPDIFRCPDCGYEQDEPGFCPDHIEVSLIRVPDKNRDPLAPPELDGNEDLIVDIPLRGIQFRKDEPSTATDSLIVQ